jgi:hypothetical protein
MIRRKHHGSRTTFVKKEGNARDCKRTEDPENTICRSRSSKIMIKRETLADFRE